MDTPLPLSRWLKQLRTQHDLTQETLAQQVGCSPEMIRALEGGRRRASRAMAERLADVLHLDPEQHEAFLLAARAVNAAPTEPAPATPVVTSPQAGARLVVPPTALIGRAAEVADLCRRLAEPGTRLITVLGPGGMGKTRLAVQVADALRGHFTDGVVVVALAALSAPAQVATALASACGCPLTPARAPDDIVLEYLRARHVLLVLDNMEHVLGATALLAAILREAPQVRMLVTSRERLRLHGEQSFELGSLALPHDDTASAVDHAPAVLLFVERARHVVQDFVLSGNNRHAVAEICRHLDGMPLAIELAAAWSHALTPAEIVTELSRGLDLLASSDRDEEPRHRSMRAALDYSWALLTADEQHTLARLSVFRGGCDRATAVAVVDASLPVLGSLIDKSLLRREQRERTTRYTLHELVRQYAAERLAKDAVVQAATEARYAAYYAALLQRSISAHTGGSSPEGWTQVLGEMDNLRHAWLGMARLGDTANLLSMLRGMMVLYEHHCWWIDGVTVFGQAADTLDVYGEPANVARGLIRGTQGYFLLRSGQPAAGAVHLEEGLALMQAAEALPQAAFLVFNLGTTELYAGRIAPARDRYAQAIGLAKVTGDDFVRLWAEYFLGVTMLYNGDFAAAEQQFVVCRDAWQAQGFARGLAAANIFLGETLRLMGQLAPAEVAIRVGLGVGDSHQDVLMIAMAHRELSALALDRGTDDEAYVLAADSTTCLHELDDRFAYGRSCALLVRLQVRRGMLDAAREGCAELLRMVRTGSLLTLPDAGYGMALLYHTAGEDVEALAILQALDGTPGEYATLQLAAQLRTALEERLTPALRSRAAEQAPGTDLLSWLEELCARLPTPPTAAPLPDDPPIVPLGGLYIAATGETLSPREVEVLRLMIAGASNPQIAGMLVISRYTVKHHVGHILRKLDVATRTEAALLGRDLGVAPLAPQ